MLAKDKNAYGRIGIFVFDIPYFKLISGMTLTNPTYYDAGKTVKWHLKAFAGKAA